MFDDYELVETGVQLYWDNDVVLIKWEDIDSVIETLKTAKHLHD